jgi:hypothetical protein
MIGLALGGVLGHWVVGGLLIAMAAIAALQGLVFNSRSFSNVVLVVAFLAFAFYGLG